MAGAKKSTGSQKKATKSKAAQSAADRRRRQRKATGQAAQKAGKYKNVKSSPATTRARSRLQERKRKKRRMMEANKPLSVPKTPPEMSPRNIAAQQAAARQAAAQRAAQAARMMSINNPRSAPRTPPEMSPRNIAAQQAAARRAAQMGRVRPKAKPEGMSLSRFKAGLYNLLPEGMRRAGPDTSGMTAKEKFDANPARQAFVRSRERRKKRRDRAADNVVPPKPTPEIDDFGPELPPEVTTPVMPPVMPPRFPQYPGMGGGIGAFGYNPALLQFESQQGAGQVPYYMAAARNAMTPNMSPAFMHAARNYDILGGMQRTAPRPMEMMSAAERAQIAGMSNFSTPNYNSPYDQFNFFSNMVSSGMPTQVPTGPSGKGARPSGVGLGALLASGMFG